MMREKFEQTNSHLSFFWLFTVMMTVTMFSLSESETTPLASGRSVFISLVQLYILHWMS